jgi:hypothetical protein
LIFTGLRETLTPAVHHARTQAAASRAGIFASAGVIMPPRATLEPGDLVTPTAFATLTGVPASTVRTWIQRSTEILGRKVEPLGTLGRWPAYDYNDLAALEAAMRLRTGACAA